MVIPLQARCQFDIGCSSGGRRSLAVTRNINFHDATHFRWCVWLRTANTTNSSINMSRCGVSIDSIDTGTNIAPRTLDRPATQSAVVIQINRRISDNILVLGHLTTGANVTIPLRAFLWLTLASSSIRTAANDISTRAATVAIVATIT